MANFDNPDGFSVEPVNPSKLKLPLRNSILKWLILLALFLLIVSFASFWFGKPSFSEANVVFNLEGPNQASVGDEVVYKLTLGNNSKVDLSGIKIKFNYPEDSVVIEDGSVVSDLSREFEIEKLSPGQKNEMEFKAFLVGDRGNIKTIKAELNFKAGDLRTQFQKETSTSTTITSLAVSLTLASPPNIVPGQTVNYTLDYRNESGSDIEELLFEFNYPDDFTFQKGTPSPSQKNNVWVVSVLRRDAGGRINIQGILAGKEGEIEKMSVVLKRKIAGQYIDYEKAEVLTKVASPLLNVDVLVNNSAVDSAFPGDDMNYAIRYSNNSNFNLIGLNLVVKLDGQMFDFSSLDTNGGFFDNQNRTIIWNAGSVADFANLSPNKNGEVLFKIKLKTEIPSGISGSNNLFVQAAASLSTPNVPSGVGGDEISVQNSLTTKITSQPTFKQLIYYNDPAFGSFGPLPPEVGKDTFFTIHWQITNPGNDMSDVRIVGVLPSGTTWESMTSVTAGQPEIIFNSNTSEVLWNLGILPRGTGVIGDKYEGSFRIKIRPSSNQAGEVITLIKNAKLMATDSFTKQNIILNLGDMATDNLFDKPNQGMVQP